MEMVRNKDSIPGMTRADVFRLVHSEMCGFQGNAPKVFCNEEEEAEEDENESAEVRILYCTYVDPFE